jgi:hypothetical protein
MDYMKKFYANQAKRKKYEEKMREEYPVTEEEMKERNERALKMALEDDEKMKRYDERTKMMTEDLKYIQKIKPKTKPTVVYDTKKEPVTLKPKIILPFFNLKKDDKEDPEAWKNECYNRVDIANVDDVDKVVYYESEEDGNTYCLLIDDLKRQFNNDIYFNPYSFGNLLNDKFIIDFKNKYMKDDLKKDLSVENIKKFNSLPSLYEIIKKDIITMQTELLNITNDTGISDENDSGVEKSIKCNYCKEKIDNVFLKSIVHDGKIIKDVHFCSFKCFENTDNSHWPSKKRNN